MTVQTDPAYVFERSSDEYLRLTRQAALFEPMTERLFRDAGITPGMRVLDVGQRSRRRRSPRRPARRAGRLRRRR